MNTNDQRNRPSYAPTDWALFAAAALLMGALAAWAFLPTLHDMQESWSTNPQYSHGYLVPLFSLVLLYLRRHMLTDSDLRPLYLSGLAALLASAAMRLASAKLYFNYLDSLAMLVCLTGIALLAGGRGGLRWAWPAIAFLVFMLPLPYQVEVMLRSPLRRIATLSSTFVMQTLGLPAVAEGNTILINETTLGVAEACSGLCMLMVFAAQATAVAILIRRPLWEKLLVALSAAPIAIAANVIRITITALLMTVIDTPGAVPVIHDYAGLFMMPIALLLLWAEVALLSFVLEDPDDDSFVPAPA